LPRRFQYSLATLLWFVTAFCCLCSIAACNRWLAAWVVVLLGYSAFTYWIARLLARVHLSSAAYLGFGITAIGSCFDLATSLGGGIKGIDRTVFMTCSCIGILIGVGFLLIALGTFEKDLDYWQERLSGKNSG